MVRSLSARRRALISAAAVLPLVFVAACGSSSSSESSSAPAESSAAASEAPASEAPASEAPASMDPAAGALAEAQARVEAALVPPTTINEAEPLAAKPPEGINVTYLQCGVEICNVIGSQMDSAAQVLGWNVTLVDQGTTPEEILAGWDTALNANPKPDAIITAGVPAVLIQPKLDEAAAAGITVIDYASGSPPGTPGIAADLIPITDNEERGRLMADWAAVETNGNAKALFLNVPDYVVINAGAESFKAQLESICPDTCSTEIMNYAATDIGTKVPADVVSYLQQNPDTNIIVYGLDDIGLGVGEAIAAAGLEGQVKAVGQGGGVATIDAIANDRTQVATIPQGMGQLAWSSIDALARIFSDTPLDTAKYPSVINWLQTKDTLTDGPWLGTTDPAYQDVYTQLWLAG